MFLKSTLIFIKLFQLQEPKDGGEVVFGGAKTIGSPVRGSAIVWYDCINHDARI